MSKHLVLKPRISEQTFSFAESGVYVFMVPQTASKQEIKAAVESQYEVGVTNVNVTTVKGKAKSSMRKRLQPRDGKRADRKKAYVTLKKGDSLTLFEDGQ